MGKDYKTLFVIVEGKENIQITKERGGGFISLGTLEGKIGDIRNLHNLSNHKSYKSLSVKAVEILQKVTTTIENAEQNTVVLFIFALSKFRGKLTRDHSARVVSTHGQNDLCECTRCIVCKVVLQGLEMCKSIYNKCTC